MRGPDIQQDSLFSTVSPDARVPQDHPLRPIRTMVDAALKEMDQDFNALYAASGRDSIPPEKLLRAQLLMAFYTIRSERQLMEQINYNLLFRWFVGFSMDDEVWDHSTFTKNRDRLLGGEVAQRFFAQVLGQAERADLLSKEHFSVDGTLIESLASLKSYRPKDEDDPPDGGGRNPSLDFHGEKRSRDTHESKTDKDALLFKKSKGTAAKLSADKNYDTQGCVDDLRCVNVTPHVAQNTSNRSSAIDGRTTCHPGYATSQVIRKRIEECFGWAKTIGGLRKSRFIGREKLDFQFVLTFAAYNLIRMRNLPGGAMLIALKSRGWSACHSDICANPVRNGNRPAETDQDSAHSV